MSFEEVLDKFSQTNFQPRFNNISDEAARALLNKKFFSCEDLPILLSEAAVPYLAALGEIARAKTLQYFGKTIKMYAPLYLSSYCCNQCEYCNFSPKNKDERRRLSIAEALSEAQWLAAQGFRHLLLVAGEDPDFITLEYLSKLIRALKPKFNIVAVEVAPLSAEGYKILAEAGLDGVTIYQETYDRKVYQTMHGATPKGDFSFRLKTPERGAQANLREVGIGFLLGLADWRVEGLCLGLHAAYLQKYYWQTHLAISFPRIKRTQVHFVPPHYVDDKVLVQLIIALRLVFPQIDLTLSTRERAELRDALIGYGITKMSAGSSTRPGGYLLDREGQGGQFEVEDTRKVSEVAQSIMRAGFEPVFKDWQ
jgi:2-iminoacetate synthase